MVELVVCPPQMTVVRLTPHQSSNCVSLIVVRLILCLQGRTVRMLGVRKFSFTEIFRCCLRHTFDAPPLLGSQYVSSFLQNPYYFMYASLAQPDEDVEIHWFNVRIFFGPESIGVSHCGIRAARQGVPPDLWFHPYIISRTRRIVGKMLPFSYSPISV